MSVLQNAQELYAMIGQGQMIEALDKFYADDCRIQEADGTIREGKEAQKAGVQQWVAGIQEMHGGGVGSITANEETGHATVESWTDITMGGNRFKMEEVAVQKWENGKIVHERFYYNMAGMQPPQQ